MTVDYPAFKTQKEVYMKKIYRKLYRNPIDFNKEAMLEIHKQALVDVSSFSTKKLMYLKVLYTAKIERAKTKIASVMMIVDPTNQKLCLLQRKEQEHLRSVYYYSVEMLRKVNRELTKRNI